MSHSESAVPSELTSESMTPEAVRDAVTAVTRLYAQACESAGRELPPVDASISTTEALTLACALLRSQDLTPFDMALWFSHGAPGSPQDEPRRMTAMSSTASAESSPAANGSVSK